MISWSGSLWWNLFKSLIWHECSYFYGFISVFNDAMLSVVGDIPVDNKVSIVTS